MMGKVCWHKWGKWSFATDSYDGKYQHSICEKCLAIKARKLPYDGSTSAKVLLGKFESFFVTPPQGQEEGER